jgi:hypothetical protein
LVAVFQKSGAERLSDCAGTQYADLHALTEVRRGRRDAQNRLVP